MDVWLLVGLTLPFISFILSILEELLQDKKEDEARVPTLLSESYLIKFPQTWTAEGNDMQKGTTKKISKQRIVQILGRFVLPLITAAFVLLYISVAAYIYNSPALKYN